MLNLIKSQTILGIIFQIVKYRTKLKIVKYSKSLMNKLNIKIKNFQDYLLLKEINHRYNLDIEDVDIEKIIISDKVLNDNFIEIISKIDFFEIKEIHLENDYI